MTALIPNVLQMKAEFIQATLETLYMTAVSALVAGILGLGFGGTVSRDTTPWHFS